MRGVITGEEVRTGWYKGKMIKERLGKVRRGEGKDTVWEIR